MRLTVTINDVAVCLLSSQGQVEALVSSPADAPDRAEFYVVVRGSALTHVTAAKRGADGRTLCYTVPGTSFRPPSKKKKKTLHVRPRRPPSPVTVSPPRSPSGHAPAEAAAVTSYFYAAGRVEPCEGRASLQYLADAAQEAAEHLRANRERLGPRSHLEVLERFSAAGLERREEEDGISGGESGLGKLDEKITQAMANMEYPQQWSEADAQPREGGEPRSCGFLSGFCTLWSI